eukprot:CAMPEP_0198151442 /NCGR_PEP_ID=MMETSP1443-20131203/55551_1 /TAXON_ID=186043 /ORGANISM="Entomoneis sp., Strain CCMP2396" /LENGTH=405 /DNA_ID=CAMNT_0043817097 /DNA_START=250 /DNA_END=1467 /DNA_ORIENTATION=+
MANQVPYLYRKLKANGGDFCCAGGVWLSDFDDIAQALTEPQARSYRLASSLIDPKHIPMIPEHGRNVFLLSLSDKDAGGNGDHEAFRAAMDDFVFNDQITMERQNNTAICDVLFSKLASDYLEMGHSDTFFHKDNDRGWKDFLLRYLHYVVFGLDPTDDKIMKPLDKLHNDSASAAYYLKHVGNALQCCAFRKWPERFTAAGDIYAKSPALKDFTTQAKYNQITNHELSMALLAIMSLAGMVGPHTLGVICLGQRPFNDYAGHDTKDIDVTKIWDALDLDNREEVKNYIFECGRLRTPVSNTHKIATAEFTTKIRGKNVTFPKGTTIFIPMQLAMINEAFWGPTTFKFDHNREKLCPFSMMFHSVGDKSNGRLCPGRGIAMRMLTDVLITLGKVRRSHPEKFQST